MLSAQRQVGRRQDRAKSLCRKHAPGALSMTVRIDRFVSQEATTRRQFPAKSRNPPPDLLFAAPLAQESTHMPDPRANHVYHRAVAPARASPKPFPASHSPSLPPSQPPAIASSEVQCRQAVTQGSSIESAFAGREAGFWYDDRCDECGKRIAAIFARGTRH